MSIFFGGLSAYCIVRDCGFPSGTGMAKAGGCMKDEPAAAGDPPPKANRSVRSRSGVRGAGAKPPTKPPSLLGTGREVKGGRLGSR